MGAAKKICKIEAKAFISDLHKKLFEEGDEQSICKFYTDDVIGHYRDEVFNINDIFDCIIAIKENTKNFSCIIEDICIANDLIVVLMRQNWLNRENEQLNESTLTGIYRFKNDKIAELWMLLDHPVSSYKNINAGFKKEMQAFELNAKAKDEFLKRLATIEKTANHKHPGLSKVEQECLYYYFHGFSAKETALQMGISFRTVQAYVAQIKERFGCTTKIELRKKLFAELAK